MLRAGIIAGYFVGCCLFARPGDVDLSFNPALAANYRVEAVCEQVDGKLLLGGVQDPAPPAQVNQRGFIIRFHPDGQLDRSFRINWGKDAGYGDIHQIIIRPGGNIGVLGVLGQGSAVLSRRGQIRSFYRPEEEVFSRGCLLPDGTLIYSGPIEVPNRGFFNQLRTMNPRGKRIFETPAIWQDAPDNSSFSAFEWLRALPDGNVIGCVTQPRFEGDNRVNRYFLYSSSWGQTEFIDTQPYGTAAAGPTNSAYLGGSAAVGLLTRRLAGWQIDESFQWQFPETASAPWTVRAIAVQADGKVVYCAVASATGVPFTLQRVYRCHSDGSNDPAFDVGNGPNAPVQDFLVLRSGKILAWGRFKEFNGVTAQTIVRLETE